MSTAVTVLVSPRDPVLVRDGRPFSAEPGARAFTLRFPLPSTMAGAMRTHVGNSMSGDWRSKSATVKTIAVEGPLLVSRDNEHGWTVRIVAPADALIYVQPGNNTARIMRLSPVQMSSGSGCSLPAGLLPLSVTEEVKPESGYDYWTLGETANWLSGQEIVPAEFGGLPTFCMAMSRLAWTSTPAKFGALPTEGRVHVAIKDGTAEEGKLFATESLAFADAPGKRMNMGSLKKGEPFRQTAMLCRVAAANGAFGAPTFFALGGERRAARLEPAPAGCEWPQLPAALKAVDVTKRLKLQLVTPGLFAGGWRPGWIDAATLEGSLPGGQGVRVKLVAAAVPRRIPVSGWDYAAGGPKATRYAAPAGSVFFFEVLAGSPKPADLWMKSICDDAQDRLDGFGFAIPGTWDYATNARTEAE